MESHAPPAMQWARRHDIVAEADELPDGVDPNVLGSRWIWEELVQSSHFRLDRVKRARAYDHINLSELFAFGEAEHIATGDHCVVPSDSKGSQRSLIGTDSQVVAACIAKGRSGSPPLNAALRTFLPNLWSHGLYSLPFWIGTKFNVADDPTRDAPLRPASIETPEWLKAIAVKDYVLFDKIAADLLYDASAPPLSDLACEVSQHGSRATKTAKMETGVLDKKGDSVAEQENNSVADNIVSAQEVRRPGVAVRAPGEVLLAVEHIPIQEVYRPARGCGSRPG